MKKEKEKRKLGKISNKINKYIITFTFSYRKNYILLENIFEKNYFISLHLHYNLFTWQVIGNAVMKQQCPYRDFPWSCRRLSNGLLFSIFIFQRSAFNLEKYRSIF